MSLGRNRKLVVLGGGIGSLSAIYAITSQKDWNKDFKSITVFEESWRLGGKGASGRNKDACFRSEEHGLHIWLGFYDNALRLIDNCYKKLDPKHGHKWRAWDDAFTPLNQVLLFEEGFPDPIKVEFPPRGDIASFGMSTFILRAAGSLSAFATGKVLSLFTDIFPQDEDDDKGRNLVEVAERIDKSVQAMSHGDKLDDDALEELTDDLRWTLWTFKAREQQVPFNGNADLYRLWILMDLSFAILLGIFRGRIYERGFQSIDDTEWTEWMRRNLATRMVLNSAPVRACYDLIFGYVNGDARRRSVGAGTGTNCLLRMIFRYRNAFAYQLKAGMGEVVFAPLYHVLKDRGVKFEFFHRVTDVRPTSRGTAIGEIHLERLRRVKSGLEYKPVFDCSGLQCWPTEPFEDQLVPERSGSTETLPPLVNGEHFDDVILGIPPPTLKNITTGLQAASADWRRMTNHVATTATVSAQLWMKVSTSALGWGDASTLYGAYRKPFDTIWDADRVIQTERFPSKSRPKSAMYLCGTIADGDDPRQRAKAWIKAQATGVWRNATQVGQSGFDWKCLYDPLNRKGEDRLDWQEIHGNFNGSARYVQSRPRTSRHRLRSDRSGFSNLWLAGDWTRTGLNAGCMEAAVMSGLRAGRGVSGYDTIHISGEANEPILPRGPFNLVHRTVDKFDDAQGDLEAVAVVLALPLEDVKAMLPKSLEVVPQKGSPQGLHPIGILFGHHWNVGPAIAPDLVGAEYNEVAIAVPFVRTKRDSGNIMHTFLPILLLDSVMFSAVGRLGYGFNKKICNLTIGGGYRRATTQFRRAPLLTFDTKPAGPAQTADEFPNLDLARQIFSLPVLTHRFGDWRPIKMSFNFDDALVTPVLGQLEINNVFLDGLRRQKLRLASINSDRFGAFSFRCSWKLT